jgi:hypothetical protein
MSSGSSWRACPFEFDRKYRVRFDLKLPRDQFRAGEVLTYESEAHSAYHSHTGYFFHDESGAGRVLDVADDHQGDDWHDVLEPVAAES